MGDKNIYTMTYEHNGEKFIKTDMTIDACIITMQMNKLSHIEVRSQGLKTLVEQMADRQEM